MTQRENKLICCPNWEDQVILKQKYMGFYASKKKKLMIWNYATCCFGLSLEILRVNLVLIKDGQKSYEIYLIK